MPVAHALEVPAAAQTGAARPPGPVVVWSVALAGIGAAAIAAALALTTEVIGTTLGEPLVVAMLFDWITSLTSSAA